MQDAIKKRAKELLKDGTCNRVLCWEVGEFVYDPIPCVFTGEEKIDNNLVYNEFCGANLSKYLIKESHKVGKILVFLKPCDTYSFNQLLSEHRICRENVYACGIECNGKVDIEELRKRGFSGITDIESDGDELIITTIYGNEKSKVKASDVLAERCKSCKSKKHVVYDELIGNDGEIADSHRFDMVKCIESMSADERFSFWRNELSRCIRCNACRNVCPACNCEKCIFDNPNSGVENKAAADAFEENLFHIIRAYHVAGRCTDCGECSRVCPEHIPLHLLNRKFIKDINELYGEYTAGETVTDRFPLTTFGKDDVDPSVVRERGEKR